VLEPLPPPAPPRSAPSVSLSTWRTFQPEQARNERYSSPQTKARDELYILISEKAWYDGKYPRKKNNIFFTRDGTLSVCISTGTN
jgi:hypothetical protein